jgi:hypothetical protein
LRIHSQTEKYCRIAWPLLQHAALEIAPAKHWRREMRRFGYSAAAAASIPARAAAGSDAVSTSTRSHAWSARALR